MELKIQQIILEQHSNSIPIPEIAKQVNLNPSTVRRFLKTRTGATISKPTRIIEPEEASRIRSGYLAGHSKEALCLQFKMGKEKLNEVLGTLPSELASATISKINNATLQEQEGLSWEEAVDKWRGFINQSKPSRVVAPKSKTSKTRKILNLSDLHIPFCDFEFVKQSIADNKDADICILSGDIIDAYSISRFSKYNPYPSLREELQAAKVVVEELARTFPRLIIFAGNHEHRIKNSITQRLDSQDLMACIRIHSITELLGVDCPNIEVPIINVEDNEIDWIWSEPDSDLVIGHPEASGAGAMKGIAKFVDWLRNWHSVLGIPELSVVAMGHTHKYSQGVLEGNILGIETGCMCKIQGYSLNPDIKYAQPQVNGYTTFIQEYDGSTWITDRNQVRFVEKQ